MARPGTHHFWRSSALPFVEARFANDSAACYAPHTHPTLSLGAVEGGRSIFQCGRRRRTLSRGDVVFIPAGEMHACNPLDKDAWSYQMLYLDEAWVRAVIGEIGNASPTIECRPRPALPPEQSHAGLSAIVATLFSRADERDKEAALIEFVGDFFAARRAPAADATSGWLSRVKTIIEERYRETLSLETLAQEAGMSRYHLLRAFRETAGMTPHAWQIDLRIREARRLISEGMPLAEAALHLGFADQSHFQRAFKQRVAATPGEYRGKIPTVLRRTPSP